MDAKAFLLTYSQTALTKQTVYDFLCQRSDVLRMIVGEEHHQDGNLHIHAYVVYNKARDVGYKAFDIEGEHPNIQTHKPSLDPAVSMINAWAYCKKEDLDPLIVGAPPPPPAPTTRKRAREIGNGENPHKRKRDDLIRECMDIAGDRNATPYAAYEHLMKYSPALAIERASAYKLAFQLERTKCLCPLPAVRSLDDFPLAPALPECWRVLFINGPTNCGKTAWARALLPHATVVRHRDSLKDCDMFSGIIFDDFETLHWPACSVIHLLDWDDESGIDVKHGHVVIPCNTRKIFTYNGTFSQWTGGDRREAKAPYHGYEPSCPTEYQGYVPRIAEDKYPRSESQLEAMRRRVHVVNITGKLFLSAQCDPKPVGFMDHDYEDGK